MDVAIAKEKRYGWLVALIFFLTWGLIFLDRLTISLTSEVIIEEMNLTTMQFSSLSAVSTFTYAVSAIAIGIISDKLGWRKKMLVPFTLLAGLLSFLCTFAQSYNSLLVMRALVGFFEGPTLTLMMAILAVASFKGTFGRNAGIVMAGVAVIANTLGPIIVTQTITSFEWNTVFMVTGVAIILCALLVSVMVKDVEVVRQPQLADGTKQKSSIKQMFTNRNFVLCSLIGIFCMVGYWTTMIFAPIYLADVMNMTTTERGFVASIMGLIFIPISIFVPTISDKIGRKPIMIIAFIAAVISPFSMWVWAGFGISVVLYCIFGGIPGAMPTLFANVIPMESLPDELKASAGGVILGLSDTIGGAIWPLVAVGVAESMGGISSIMMFAAILLTLCVIMSVFLIETITREKNKKVSAA